ncbi:MAG: T9SS type A sorting domain-containing protein, partial [Candidatus Cloacimonetes bacterium]|nr:T9SS type A sorting domain-containing protein [Candidatus Cloacimonadota bacterium]
FIARMEEYFKVAFETADALDPQIDFGSYGHYMIIHAGSDWQHDVRGDTPSDLPSFFIRVGAGKEAVVNNGTVLIPHACNVPSMITQDLRSYTENDTSFNAGYGALNSVVAHEFGHSLGLVDLYNVFNYQPMVGVFDIMDSGGTGVMVDGPDDDGSYTQIEGILPVLPGAWSRKLLFEDYYRQTGHFKDVDQIPLYQDIRLSAASHGQNPANIQPTILKIPLNANEYVLVENRNVDPDGDGGTAVFGALNGRVILHPTAYNDETNQPTYEYDYLLPSFIDPQDRSIGGGVMVWHIDNDMIYNQGVIDSEGNFRSHFENNTVNVIYNRRGVKIIEADGLPDIGYDYSWFWTGTPFEYFHKNKPNLNANGEFLSWSGLPWRPDLGPETSPPLVDNAGLPGFYSLSDIDHPSPNMSLRVNGGFFDTAQVISFDQDAVVATPLINSSFSSQPELPVISASTIDLHTYTALGTAYTWINQMGSFDLSPVQTDHPIVTADVNANGYTELVTVKGNGIRFLEFALDDLSDWGIATSAVIPSAPLFHQGYLYYLSGDHLHRYNSTNHDSLRVSQALTMAAAGNKLYVISSGYLDRVTLDDFTLEASLPLPERAGPYEPVVLDIAGIHYLFFLAETGHLYRYGNGDINKVFHNPHSANQPTQLALLQYDDRNPAVVFGIADRIYALRMDGTLLAGYPQNIHPWQVSARSHPLVLAPDGQTIVLMPLAGGYLATDTSGGINRRYSLVGNRPSGDSYLVWMNVPGTVIWYYCDQDGNLHVFGKPAQSGDPIVWNGFRNGGTGVFSGLYQADDPPVNAEFSALIFPNPVRSGSFHVRLENAPEAVQISIYNIVGQLIHAQSFTPYPANNRDLLVEVGKLSPGVYLAVVEHDGKSKRIRFARD